MEFDRVDILMNINQKAFEDGNFDLAYHALHATYESACRHENLDYALLVEDRARTQGEWIDEHAPFYEHSTNRVKARGSLKEGIFHELALQASSLSKILKLL